MSTATLITPDDSHGRPRVLEVRAVEGGVDVHVERDTHALWMFMRGPRGGDRGHVVIPVGSADRLLAWHAGERDCAFFSGVGGSVFLRPKMGDERYDLKLSGRLMKPWAATVDVATAMTFLDVLAEWAERVPR